MAVIDRTDIALEKAERMIRECQKVLAEWIPPDSGVTDKQALLNLLEVLDGPNGRDFDIALAQARGGFSHNPLEASHALQETRQ